MSSQGFFGWDLLYRTIQSDIKSEADVIVAIIHWYLTKNESFKCLGIGDDKTLSTDDEGSELLPVGWNENENSFALRYVFNKELFILLGALTEGLLVVNLLNVDTKKASNLSVSTSETVKSLDGNIKTMIPEISELTDRIKNELVNPVFSGATTEQTTQTSPNNSRRSSNSRIPESGILPHRGIQGRMPGIDPLRDIGRGDLDPLNRGGGGMLFPGPGIPGCPLGNMPPFPGGRMGFIPPPPGARFDPFGPPGAGNPNPNPDHFRPPPDFDDMYM
ncbi:proteasome inhibitor PI31 subunit [Condylostylus longicornis]|uniref:proteasome inhibitor PI31 subunit n=1 Tax=Condylostylus longicornis TaxID=2530218 RepID=UPI00244E0C3E|nr:proteasome inhibitor PI31 subunit [Condylostylus longicornis]